MSKDAFKLIANNKKAHFDYFIEDTFEAGIALAGTEVKSLRMGKELKPGYVLTIEPGIYFIPELIKKWEKEGRFKEYINYEKVKKYLDFGGMRYEGDFLITENGNRRLGDKMPKYDYEIEEILKK